MKAILFFVATCCLISSSSLASASDLATDLDSASTSLVSSSIELLFEQKFHVGNGRVFNDNEIEIFQYLMESYTNTFIVANNYTSLCPELVLTMGGTEQEFNDELINNVIISKCTVQSQKHKEEVVDVDVESTTTTNNSVNNSTATTATATAATAANDDDFVNAVRYIISYESSSCNNLMKFPLFFQNYVNQSLDTMINGLLLFNLDIINIEQSAQVVSQNNN